MSSSQLIIDICSNHESSIINLIGYAAIYGDSLDKDTIDICISALWYHHDDNMTMAFSNIFHCDICYCYAADGTYSIQAAPY